MSTNFNKILAKFSIFIFFIVITYSTQAQDCNPTANLYANNLTNTSAELHWSPIPDAQDYTIEYGETGFSPGTGTTVTTAEISYILTDLTTATTYDFYVTVNCLLNNSTQSEAYTFTTISDIALSDGGTCSDVILTYSDVDETGRYMYSGVSDLGTLIMAYNSNNSRWEATVEGTVVYYNEDATTPFIPCIDHGTWVNASQSCGDFTQINGDCISECGDPIRLYVTQVTATAALLHWTLPDNQLASAVEYGLTGFSPGMQTPNIVNTEYFYATGLSFDTEYDFYVQFSDPVCGMGSQVGPFTFKTLITNDSYEYAHPISIGETWFGDSDEADSESPFEDRNCGSGAGGDENVWYTFMGDGNLVTLSLCNSDFDTQLDVFCETKGINCTEGGEDSQGCADEKSQVTFETIANMTYYVQVTGDLDDGNYELEMSTAVCTPPSNIDCGDGNGCRVYGSAMAITVDETTNNTISADNTCATRGDTPTCNNISSFSDAQDLWYSFTAPTNGKLDITLTLGTALDMNWALFDDCTESNLVNCADSGVGTTSIAGLTAGAIYYLKVYSRARNAGTFDLDISNPVNIFYVKPDGNDAAEGVSWATAFANLQTALVTVEAGDTIWVAGGTYYPDEGTGQNNNARPSTFVVNAGIAVYGGFAGTETELSQRILGNNESILSGDIDGNGTLDNNNAYHVVTILNLTDEVQLDGFTIEMGYADSPPAMGQPPFDRGAGLFNTNTEDFLHLENCLFQNNYALTGGAAAYCDARNEASNYTVFQNCRFTENNSDDDGGAVYASSNGDVDTQCFPRFINCIFDDNIAQGDGGAVYAQTVIGATRPAFTNCTFYNNDAIGTGDAIYGLSISSNIYVTNCIFWEDLGNAEADILAHSSDNKISLSYSIVPFSDDGMLTINFPDGVANQGNNNNLDPLLMDAANNDFRLQPCSPAIQAGDNDADLDGGSSGTDLISSISTDFYGNERFFNTTIDIGSHESPTGFIDNTVTRLYVDVNTSEFIQDGKSWLTAYTDLESALAITRSDCGSGVTEIWVAAGTYYPSEDNPLSADNSSHDVTFYINKDLNLYGGFDGTEDELTDRDYTNNITILDGDIGILGDDTDNAYHVLVVDGFTDNVNVETYIDGFTLQNGHANNTTPDNQGGAAYLLGASSLTLNAYFVNCLFQNNQAEHGGAVTHEAGDNANLNAQYLNCQFVENTATANGGALYFLSDNNQNGSQIYQSIFKNNSAGNEGGAIGIYIDEGNTNLQSMNNLFLDNTATNKAGALYIEENDGGSLLQVFSNTFYGNYAQQGGALFQTIINSGTLTDIQNCILWGNPDAEGEDEIAYTNAEPFIQHSIVKGGDDGIENGTAFSMGMNNINADPYFVNTAQENFSLEACSPALDTGSDAANTQSEDIAGNARYYNTIDIGAYELQEDPVSASGTRLYVNVNGWPVTPDGSSWDNAFMDLQSALKIANLDCSGVTEIWVAQGTYFPSADNPASDEDDAQDVTFYIERDFAIYGGFDGTEMELTERDVQNNPTILSGDIGVENDNSDNAYHVLHLNSSLGKTLTTACIIDGFTISEGLSDGGSSDTNKNSGAGIRINAIEEGSSASPLISNCFFTQNEARFGAAISLESQNSGHIGTAITHCTFQGNTGFWGGAIRLRVDDEGTGDVTISDCLFYENTTSFFGSTLYYQGEFGTATVDFNNCTTYNNSSIGGNIYNYTYEEDAHTLNINNSILWNNSTAGVSEIDVSNNLNLKLNYSIVENGNAGLADNNTAFQNGTGNLEDDPLFTDAAAYNFNLQDCSPAINAGNDSANDQSTDLAGNDRFSGTIDMGPYEKTNGGSVEALTLYVDATSTALAPDGLSWATAFSNLQDALDISYLDCSHVNTINIAEGLHYPSLDNPSSIDDSERDYVFYINKELQLAGGFPSGGGEMRSVSEHSTILSGDLGTASTISDNAYHVLWVEGVNFNLDGISIQDGNADDTGSRIYGGGVYLNYSDLMGMTANFNNCDFSFNYGDFGGALYLNGEESNVEVNFSNCIFNNNQGNGAGAFYLFGEDGDISCDFTNCLFTNNTTDLISSVGQLSTAFGTGELNLINCTISQNELISSNESGLFYIAGAYNNFTNDDNTASKGRGSQTANFNVVNSIMYDNTFSNGAIEIFSGSMTMNYSIFEGGDTNISTGGSGNTGNETYFADGTNNLDADPLFTDIMSGDYTIQDNSPAYNAGDDTANTEDVDLAGNERFIGTIDMGAYENSTSLATAWLSFTAKATDKQQVILDWTTLEKDIAHYQISHSINGLDWKRLGTVEAKNTHNNQVFVYQFLHANPHIGINYYRLTSIENTGATAFSDIQEVRFTPKNQLLLFPNPVHQVLQLSGDVTWMGATYEIMDVSGKRVASAVFSAVLPNIAVSNLRSGYYQLKITEKDGKTYAKGFVKVE